MTDPLYDRLQTALGAAYTLERELGGGGMSRVFLATETALGRQVVVKVLPSEAAASMSIERFKREIQLAARMQHAHIVPLLSAGEIEGLPYFIMPYVEGESLRVRLARHGELPVAEAVRVLREIASALAYAHERAIVHRDIKPDNVMLSGGAAMVTDFGVAKALSTSSNAEHGGVTSLGVALGTPAYMSPEQASADPSVDHRADIYAFGVLAYELLTGQTPFSGRTAQGLLAAHVAEPPEPIQKRRPSLSPALAALVMRCLEKRPADRPQSVSEIVHALDDLSTPSGETQPTSAAPGRADVTTSASAARRVRPRALVAIGVALVLVAGSVFAWRQSDMSVNAAAARPRSIAILPLQNVGGDTSTQFFADGMTDELTSTMAKLPGLHVASRSATAAALKAGAGDVKSAGQRLSVGAVLEGRIRRAGDRMRLTAQLTNVSDGLILWTESYDREVKDAFQVQDEVARSIAGALQVTLAGAPRSLAGRATTSPEAHDLYLRGRYVQAKYTEADIRKSLELFHAALAKDASYAAAWAGIADSWNMLADDFMAPREAAPKVREAITRGMAIDSTVPELRNVRGITAYYYDGDAHSAARMMGAALSASPRLQWATSIYPAVLWTVGKRDSAAAFLRHAVERDPAAPEVLENASSYFLATGDVTTARTYCDRLVELHEGEGCGAQLAIEAGHTDQPIAQYRRSASDPNPLVSLRARRYLVDALVKANRIAEAREIATQADAEARSGRRYIREDAIALMWARLGDYDRAMYWFERALRSGSAGIGAFYVSLAREPLRHDPRVLAFAKRAGLPDPPAYWR